MIVIKKKVKPAYVLLPKDLDSSMWITWTFIFHILRIYHRCGNKVEYCDKSQKTVTIHHRCKEDQTFCTYSDSIPTLASIFATHRRKFVKGKISFIKIKNGMKDEGNAKTTFCGFIECMVCQNYALVSSIFVNVKLFLSQHDNRKTTKL